ncbi:YigZ family protein [Marinobacteraceae bacterium S3BR75-40.1]
MTNDALFPTPAGFETFETEVRKSRFITWVAPVETREAALALLQKAREAYPDARHHCWAYVIGKPGAATNAAMSDDGEPSGTAGKPILNVIEHKGIGNVMVVVIRYFGGIKLGAGGLVRAYAGATENALSQIALIQHEPEIHLVMELDFSQEQPLRHWLAQHGGTIDAVDYGQAVRCHCRIPLPAQEALDAWAGAQGVDYKTQEAMP